MSLKTQRRAAGLNNISSLFFLGIVLWASQGSSFQEELIFQPVTDALFVVTGAGCNVVFYAIPGGVLVVDSGEKPALAEKLIAKIREISSQPIRYLVFTHYHHVVGADGFPPSAIVVAQDNTKDNIPLHRKILVGLMEKNIRELEEKAVSLRSEKGGEDATIRSQIDLRKKQLEGIRGQKEVLPQMTFDDKSTIYLGGRQIELLHFGPGHTDGDLLVYFPQEKTLAIGDLLYSNGWVPRLDGDAGASVDNWLKIFDLVAEMDVDKIVPGHGEVIDKKGFVEISKIFGEYLTDLKAEVLRFVRQGVSLEKIKAELKLPKYQHMGMADVLLPWNIEAVHREIVRDARSPSIAALEAEIKPGRGARVLELEGDPGRRAYRPARRTESAWRAYCLEW